MCFSDRLLGLRKIAVMLHEVAAGKLPLIVLPASCIISCVKSYYFRSAFLRSGFHSCPLNLVVIIAPVDGHKIVPKKDPQYISIHMLYSDLYG